MGSKGRKAGRGEEGVERKIEERKPTADRVLPKNCIPTLHRSMLEAAGLDSTAVGEAIQGFRVRGKMPHTEFYDLEQETGNKSPVMTEQELERAY